MQLKNRCRELRRNGHTLGQIMEAVALPKTTVYGYIKDIALTTQQQDAIEERKRLLRRSRPSPRKGECIPGRGIERPPSRWDPNLVHIVAHFIFDGRISREGCTYYSRSQRQIDHLREMVHKTFGIEPKYKVRKDGVRMIRFYNVEFANYINDRAKEIFSYLKNGAGRESKRMFMQAFFDDEGNVYYNKLHQRRVRGYQDSTYMSNDIKDILCDFSIDGRIYPNIKAIEITGRDNLETFASEINFSPFVSLNPNRKNSIWKKEISKRKILQLAITSYKS